MKDRSESYRRKMEAARRALYQEGLTDEEIANRQGVTRGAITKWRRARKLSPVARERLLLETPGVEAHVIQLYNDGVPKVVMALTLSVSLQTLTSWVNTLQERHIVPQTRRIQEVQVIDLVVTDARLNLEGQGGDLRQGDLKD